MKKSTLVQAHPRRIRQIRAEVVCTEKFALLSPWAQLAIIKLPICSDKNGTFVWLPRTLKSWLFPFDEMDFDAVLDELLKHGYVTKFTVEGVCYGSVTDFEEHQYINPKESEKSAVYPEPSTGMTPAPSRDVPGALPAPQ